MQTSSRSPARKRLQTKFTVHGSRSISRSLCQRHKIPITPYDSVGLGDAIWGQRAEGTKAQRFPSDFADGRRRGENAFANEIDR